MFFKYHQTRSDEDPAFLSKQTFQTITIHLKLHPNIFSYNIFPPRIFPCLNVSYIYIYTQTHPNISKYQIWIKHCSSVRTSSVLNTPMRSQLLGGFFSNRINLAKESRGSTTKVGDRDSGSRICLASPCIHLCFNPPVDPDRMGFGQSNYTAYCLHGN